MANNKPKNTFLYVLGKPGSGKSSVANCILGRDVNKVSADTTPSNGSIQKRKNYLGDWEVEVVDVPSTVGCLDTKACQQEIEDLKKIIKNNHDCGHVFLLVFRYGDRYTDEDVRFHDNLKKEFGPSVMMNQCIVLVTYGDIFGMHNVNTREDFENWWQEQRGAFRELIHSCNRRVLLADCSTRETRTGDLLEKIGRIMPDMNYGYSTSTDDGKMQKLVILATLFGGLILILWGINNSKRKAGQN